MDWVPSILLAQASSVTEPFELMWNSTNTAKVVFVTLALLSIGSWAIMFRKIIQYRRADAHGEQFLDIFRRSKRFSEVNAVAPRLFGSPMVGLFQAGYAEIDSRRMFTRRPRPVDILRGACYVVGLESAKNS